MGFLNLGSLRKTFEYLKNDDHVGGWHGEDLVAVVVEDELVLEVPGPWWRWTPPSNPGVAALGILEIFFSLHDDIFIGPMIGPKGITVKALRPLLVVLAGDGLRVQRGDRNLMPAVGVAAVGREGEDSDLISSLRRGGRIRLDLLRVGLI